MCLGGWEVARSGIERDGKKIDKRYAVGSKVGGDAEVEEEAEGSLASYDLIRSR